MKINYFQRYHEKENLATEIPLFDENKEMLNEEN